MVRIVLEQSLVSSLKKVAALITEPVEAIGERAEQPVHPGDEVGLGRLEDEVKVVAHDDVGVDQPVVAFTGFAEREFKSMRRAHGAEQVAAVVTAACAPLAHR